MSLRSVFIFVLSLLALVFLAVNWPGIVAPVPVNLIYTQVEAPLGLIVLVVFGSLWVFGIAWSLLQQASALMDIRHAYHEAQTNKHLAENAERSRLETAKREITEAVSAIEKRMNERAEEQSVALKEATSASAKTLESVVKSLEALDAKVEALAKAQDIDLTAKPGFFERLTKKATSLSESVKDAEVVDVQSVSVKDGDGDAKSATAGKKSAKRSRKGIFS